MFDPRWRDDPRDRDDDRGRRGERARDDDSGPHLGRGPNSHKDQSDADTRARHEERWPGRDRDPRKQDRRVGYARRSLREVTASVQRSLRTSEARTGSRWANA